MTRLDRQRRATLRLFVLAASAALAACGKVGSPNPPDDRDPLAPRFYPADPRRLERRDQPEIPPPPPEAFPPGISPPPDPYYPK